MAAQAGVPQLAASGLKAALDLNWDDPAARDQALAQVLGFLDLVEAFIAGLAGEQAAAKAVAAARQVRDQDVDLAGPAPALRLGVAKDRRISIGDGDMRHGRKSRSVLVDGYKRHVLRDLGTGLVPAVGITPANAAEASVTEDITVTGSWRRGVPAKLGPRDGCGGSRAGVAGDRCAARAPAGAVTGSRVADAGRVVQPAGVA
jgi:hypothetical protein